jgi:type II secretory ATPase GspE/PulE/Tfp pilus assembly ATPase PilB-like protein
MAAAMAQRLVRTICPHCKEPWDLDRSLLPKDFDLPPGQKIWRGAGCRKCRGTGYHGRTGLFELMVASDAVCEKIMVRAPANLIVAAAKAEGLRLMREDGWIKVRAGITTPEEVMRSTRA